MMKKKLEFIPYISLTTDAWTNPSFESVITMTTQFYDLDKKIIETIILKTLLVPEEKNSDYLKKILENTANEWNFLEKISGITTDNGKNFVNAIIKLGTTSHACAAHKLNLIVQKGLENEYLDGLQKKVSKIHQIYCKSSKLQKEMNDFQIKNNIIEHKLRSPVITRWNSLFLCLVWKEC